MILIARVGTDRSVHYFLLFHHDLLHRLGDFIAVMFFLESKNKFALYLLEVVMHIMWYMFLSSVFTLCNGLHEECMGLYMESVWAHTWRVYGLIHGECMGSYMKSVWAHTWRVYGLIHGECMGSYMESVWAHT